MRLEDIGSKFLGCSYDVFRKNDSNLNYINY